MADRKPAKKATQASARSTPAASKKTKAFTDEEREAMKARAREVKAGTSKADGEAAALAAIAAMQGTDRVVAARVHAIIKAAAPSLTAKTWYGMPAYAKGDKVVCFFRDARKFKERYMTFGFQPEAKLDEGRMWPTSYALMDLTPAEEAKIAALVKKAAR